VGLPLRLPDAMIRAIPFAVLLLGCGDQAQPPCGDAGVDAAAEESSDAGPEAAPCTPYVVAPWDGGPGACAGSSCTQGFGVGPGSTSYMICTMLCSDSERCPKGFGRDLPAPSNFHEFMCFPYCDDAGACPAPLQCGSYFTSFGEPDVCH
jgi:hypothetical protein